MKAGIRLFFFSLISIAGGFAAAVHGRSMLDGRFHFPRLWAFQRQDYVQHLAWVAFTIGGFCVAIAGIWLLLSKLKEKLQERVSTREEMESGLFSNISHWTTSEAFKFYWSTLVPRALLVFVGVVIWIAVRVVVFKVPLADM